MRTATALPFFSIWSGSFCARSRHSPVLVFSSVAVTLFIETTSIDRITRSNHFKYFKRFARFVNSLASLKLLPRPGYRQLTICINMSQRKKDDLEATGGGANRTGGHQFPRKRRKGARSNGNLAPLLRLPRTFPLLFVAFLAIGRKCRGALRDLCSMPS